MNDRQREIVEAAIDEVVAAGDLNRQTVGEILYQLVIDFASPPSRDMPEEPTRRRPAAGEILPSHQRASWAQESPRYDGPIANTRHPVEDPDLNSKAFRK